MGIALPSSAISMNSRSFHQLHWKGHHQVERVIAVGTALGVPTEVAVDNDAAVARISRLLVASITSVKRGIVGRTDSGCL